VTYKVPVDKEHMQWLMARVEERCTDKERANVGRVHGRFDLEIVITVAPQDRQAINDEFVPLNDDEEDDDPGQTAAIDAWIEAVLKRGGVKVRRARDGNLDLIDAPAKWVAIVEALCSGIYAAARGQELPEVTAAPKEKRKARR
jgi:hypothetical protein